jgi:hypothetical protein
LVIYIYLYVFLVITTCESKNFDIISSFKSIGLQMVVRLPVFDISHPKPPERFLVLISVRGQDSPRAIMELEGLGQFKNPVTLGIKTATFQFVA